MNRFRAQRPGRIQWRTESSSTSDFVSLSHVSTTAGPDAQGMHGEQYSPKETLSCERFCYSHLFRPEPESLQKPSPCA
jgi:hypothetical protein